MADLENNPLLNLTSAATMMLRTSPKIIKAVDDGILGEGPNATDGPWVFQGTLRDNKPFKSPLNTSMCAIVVSSWQSWGYSDYHTANYPLLQVSIYADPTRSRGTTDVEKYDAQTKALKLYSIVDSIFNDVANNNHDWLGVHVISSVRFSGPNMGDVPDNPDLVLLNVRYSVTVF